ncbi:MAG: Ig-like domain-containing protein [Chitinophagaceae bacterium]
MVNALPVISSPNVTQPSCATTGSITVNATGSGALQYSVNNGENWQDDATFPGLTPGTYNIKVRIKASPSCITTYTGNPVTLNAASGCGAPTAISLSSPNSNPSCVGSPVTFTATLTSNGSPVANQTITFTFINSAAPTTNNAAVTNASGQASVTTNSLPAGTNTVTANFAGGSGYQSSTSPQFVQIVNTGCVNATTTTLTSSPNPSCAGSPVIFTATVMSGGNPVTTGTVTFTEGVTTLASNVALNASGQAIFSTSSLTSGSHTIVAAYSGTASFNTSNGSMNHSVSSVVINNVTPTQPTCATTTGTIVIDATGTSAMEYSVNNGSNWQDGATFLGLGPNSYTIKVRLKASPNCEIAYSNNPVVLTAATGCCPVQTITAPTVVLPSCAAPYGSIIVNATSGITGLVTFVASFNCKPNIIDDGTSLYQITFIENGDFTVTDLNDPMRQDSSVKRFNSFDLLRKFANRFK